MRQTDFARMNIMRRILTAICVVTGSAFLASPALQAQSIAGTVLSAGSPIVGATVRLLDLDRIEHTGVQGQFTFPNVPKGTIEYLSE